MYTICNRIFEKMNECFISINISFDFLLSSPEFVLPEVLYSKIYLCYVAVNTGLFKKNVDVTFVFENVSFAINGMQKDCTEISEIARFLITNLFPRQMSSTILKQLSRILPLSEFRIV